jgi:hypothetical protein
MVKVNLFNLMDLNIKGIGNLVKKMVMEKFIIIKSCNLKENLKEAIKMDLVNNISKMVIITKETI